MHPTLFTIKLPQWLQSNLGISEVHIHTYALLIVVGTLLTIYNIHKRSKTQLQGYVLQPSFYYGAFIAAYIGGKFFVFLEQPTLDANKIKLIFSTNGGFVFYGSVLFMLAYLCLYAQLKNIKILALTDIVCLSTIYAIILGRLGCFFGGCCYGKVTTSAFGVSYPQSNTLVKVFPVQVYESLLMICILLILLKMEKHKNFNGKITAWFLILHAIERFMLEFLRGDFRGVWFNGFFSPAQYTALGILAICVSLLIIKLNKNKVKIKT